MFRLVESGGGVQLGSLAFGLWPNQQRRSVPANGQGLMAKS
jgi:hypothetical protein